MSEQKYSTAQRACFAGLTLGLILCVVGAIPQHWLKAEVSVNDFTSFLDVHIPFIGDSSLIELNGGVLIVCVNTGDVLNAVAEEAKGCSSFLGDNDKTIKQGGMMDIVLIAVGVNLALALICAVVAWCRCCCCKGGRTICHGISAFLSGAAGLTAVALYVKFGEDAIRLPLPNAHYDWAFYVYTAGSSLITLAAFALCFSVPDSLLGQILSPAAGQTNTYVHMSNEMAAVNNTDTDQLWAPTAAPVQAYPHSAY